MSLKSQKAVGRSWSTLRENANLLKLTSLDQFNALRAKLEMAINRKRASLSEKEGLISQIISESELDEFDHQLNIKEVEIEQSEQALRNRLLLP